MPVNSSDPEHLLPQDLPEYTYVPGISPHPVSDLRGHAYGIPRPVSTGSLQPGFYLFNYGYYWEAHEVWEAEWLALGRTGPQADFVKGLIKLAACGVKCLEQNAVGARRHAQRAMELLRGSQVCENQAAREHFMAFAEPLLTAPPLASDEQQQAAKIGGVPLLGPLPGLTDDE